MAGKQALPRFRVSLPDGDPTVRQAAALSHGTCMITRGRMNGYLGYAGHMIPKISSWIDALVKGTAITLFLLLFLLLLCQITMRLVFNEALGWIIELAQYMLISCVWISAITFTRMNAHIRIEYLYNKCARLSRTLKLLVDAFVDTASLFFLATVVVTSTRLAAQSFESISPALHIPFVYLYSVITVSSALMCYFVLEVMMRRLK